MFWFKIELQSFQYFYFIFPEFRAHPTTVYLLLWQVESQFDRTPITMNKLIRNFCCFGSKYFLTEENRKDDLGRTKNTDNVSNKKFENSKVKQKFEPELERKDIIENCDKKSRQPAQTDANIKDNKVGQIWILSFNQPMGAVHSSCWSKFAFLRSFSPFFAQALIV